MNVVIPKEYSATVTYTKQLSPKVFHLKLTTSLPIPYLPGQYGSLLLDNQRRPLSFATEPQDNHIEFIVDVSPNGVCSQFTKTAVVGTTVQLLAPYGRFLVTESARPKLFIATGSGIAPIRSQLMALLPTLSTVPIHLFFGNHNEEFMFLTEEFEALAREYANFHFTPVLSTPSEKWQGASGLVTQIIPQRISDLPNWDAYICGHPAMIEDMKAVLLSNNVPGEHIFTEGF